MALSHRAFSLRACPQVGPSATWDPRLRRKGSFHGAFDWIRCSRHRSLHLGGHRKRNIELADCFQRGQYSIADGLYRVTEPALAPIRSFMPNLGGIDISPVILILLLLFFRDVVLLGWLLPAFVGG